MFKILSIKHGKEDLKQLNKKLKNRISYLTQTFLKQ